MLACPVAERLTAQQIHHGDDDCLVVRRGMIEKLLQCVSDDLIGSIARIGQDGSTRLGCAARMAQARHQSVKLGGQPITDSTDNPCDQLSGGQRLQLRD
jgi:hypothetical protein